MTQTGAHNRVLPAVYYARGWAVPTSLIMMWIAGLSALLLPLSSCTVSESRKISEKACAELESQFGDAIILPTESDYTTLSDGNWAQNARDTPTCIVRTGDVAQLQTVVRTLVKHEVQFAIRAGGHAPAPGAANIRNGVLIDTSLFNEVTVDVSKGTARIGAGQRWGDVYSRLDAQGVSVVGGRVIDVGVAGFLLGSGLSYLSDLYGLGCDNIESADVILANGSLVTASARSNSDLLWALKGGINNFGLVTSFNLFTYPIHNVWGGFKAYSFSQLPDVMAALHEYQSVPQKDLHANLMLQAVNTNDGPGIFLNMVYLKPEESPAAFAPFYSIPTLLDTTRLQTLTEMISGQPPFPIVRLDWHTASFTPDEVLYSEISSIFSNASEIEAIQSLEGGQIAIGVQPITTNVVYEGQRKGSNALGLEARNQTWLVIDTGWSNENDDQRAHELTTQLRLKINRAASKRGGNLDYLFMNDASFDQDVIGSYGPRNVAELRRIQDKFDPHGTWRNLVPGGFKVPQQSETLSPRAVHIDL